MVYKLKKIKYKFQTKTAKEKCQLKTLLTLSPVALLLPPKPAALGLIGPRKRGKKLVLMTSARSDWT
jgi:hypothetical protein